MADPELSQNPTIVKRCPQCGETKRLADFVKNPQRKHGVHSYCKGCMRIASAKRVKARREARQQAVDDGAPTFQCTGCGEEKPISRFRYDARKPRGHSTRCKECTDRRDQAVHRRNAEERESQIATGLIKNCTKCLLSKPVSDFRAEPRNKGGSSAYCTRCLKAYFADWRSRRERGENTSPRTELKRSFGVLDTEFNKILRDQGCACAICGTAFQKITPNKKINIDHDHSSGNPRGLLCTPCNLGLGAFRDSISLLARAARYLARHRAIEHDTGGCCKS